MSPSPYPNEAGIIDRRNSTVELISPVHVDDDSLAEDAELAQLIDAAAVAQKSSSQGVLGVTVLEQYAMQCICSTAKFSPQRPLSLCVSCKPLERRAGAHHKATASQSYSVYRKLGVTSDACIGYSGTFRSNPVKEQRRLREQRCRR